MPLSLTSSRQMAFGRCIGQRARAGTRSALEVRVGNPAHTVCLEAC